MNKVKKWLGSLTGDRVSVRQISTIDIEPIAACNLKCCFCPVPGWERAKETKGMEIGLYKKIISQFPGLEHVKIQGQGEPFLNKNLIEMIRHASGRGIGTSVITNGTLLNRKLCEEVVEVALDNLTFSFDGATKETYESVRKGAEFDSVTKNIESICLLKEKKHSEMVVGIVCLVSAEQVFLELPELVQLAANLGVNEVHVKGRLKRWKQLEHGKQYRIESVYLDDFPMHDEIILKSRILAKKAGIRFSSGDYSSAYSSKHPCIWPWKALYVSTEGKVVPCCAVGVPETWCMGDLAKNNIKDIWNNKAYRELRQSIRLNKLWDVCLSCYS